MTPGLMQSYDVPAAGSKSGLGSRAQTTKRRDKDVYMVCLITSLHGKHSTCFSRGGMEAKASQPTTFVMGLDRASTPDEE
ncbi:hypothetical protein RRF57_002170 [Xylaria bambusicola]|uniref:Uncharacterized protein n=1 Tax=Xylaria bambusicola TaxID=326684 RepID=A0AAN7U6J7_9PEZI